MLMGMFTMAARLAALKFLEVNAPAAVVPPCAQPWNARTPPSTRMAMRRTAAKKAARTCQEPSAPSAASLACAMQSSVKQVMLMPMGKSATAVSFNVPCCRMQLAKGVMSRLALSLHVKRIGLTRTRAWRMAVRCNVPGCLTVFAPLVLQTLARL